MRTWLKRHRSLIGYVFLVLVALAAIELHHTQTTGDINEEARHACEALSEVSDNQRFVLNTLVFIIAHETHEDGTSELFSRLKAIETRLAGMPVFDCSKSLERISP